MIKDISEKLVNLLEDNIENYLQQIDTEVEDTTPTPRNITYNEAKNMFPEIFIDINSLEYIYRNTGTKPNKLYEVSIIIILRTSEKNKIVGWCSNYIEAIYRIVEEKYIPGVINQYLERADIIDLTSKDNMFTKSISLVLKIEE